jgi:hypothetical protein
MIRIHSPFQHSTFINSNNAHTQISQASQLRFPAKRCRRHLSGLLKENLLKENPGPAGHFQSPVFNAYNFRALAAPGDTFEQWRIAGGDKKQPWLGRKIYGTPLIHARDNRPVTEDPVKICHSTEKRFVALIGIDANNAEPTPVIDSHQIDDAERITGDVCINREQAFFEDSRILF